jgi:negative regulator of sigma-B (phosphoserine phosphatase)
MEAALAMNQAVAMEWGQASRPQPGQTQSGDAAWTWAEPGRLHMAVIDGLGHGHEAALAAEAACGALERARAASLEEKLEGLHAALRPTRGAALALAVADFGLGIWRWCGVGNISGILVSPARRERLLCKAGIVGLSMPAPLIRELPLPPDTVAVLCTDGVGESYVQEVAMGLGPVALATRLLVRHAKGTDDALVWAGCAHG